MTDPLIAAARFLTTQLDWLRHATDEQGGPYAASVFAEIRDCASRMRATVEGPADRRYLGPCGALPQADVAEFADEFRPVRFAPEPCEGDVYARDGAPAGHCRTCGATVDQAERSAWLDAEVRQRAYRASEIEDAYGIKANVIRQWATPERGLLRIHDHDVQGRARYLLSEVLDLAARQAAKRLERQADRERRAARQAAEMGA
jgi:hypothetical protein